MVRENAELPVSFDISATGGKLTGTFDSRMQRALAIPLKSVTQSGRSARFELASDTTTTVFEGRLSGRELAGSFRDTASAVGTFSLHRVARTPPPYEEREVSFSSGDVMLAGTLLLPRGGRSGPGVVFLHGSGGEGRASSRFLADHLARNGVAALIYDKRGVGRSTGDWRSVGFEALAADGAAAMRRLATAPGVDPKRVGVYGHSQGAMIASLVVARAPVRFVVGGGGGAVPVREVEVRSILNQLKVKGVTGSDLKEAEAYVRRYVNVLSTGEDWAAFDRETKRVRGSSWWPLVRVPARDNWFWPYYRRIANFDASQHWARGKAPVLLAYGERDTYVPVEDTVARLDAALRTARNPDYTLLVLPRASHAFNIEPEPTAPFEWPRLAPGFPDLILAWIKLRFEQPDRL